MTDEQRRLVRRLLEYAWPQIDVRGTISFFGLAANDNDPLGKLADGYKSLCAEVGFEPPPPSAGRSFTGPRAA